MGETVRIGVFYDGTWFAYLSDFYATAHPRGARVSLDGLHDALRWYVHTETGRPLDECVVAEAHYVRGRIETPAESFDRVLAAAGITRHDLPLHNGKEKGVDVLLALEAWDRATTVPLQWVVLLTGDSDFAPLAERLTARGVHVIVPVVDIMTVNAPPAWTPRTAAPLRAATPFTPGFDQLFAPGDQADYPLRRAFVRSSQVAASPVGAPRGRRKGTVATWKTGQAHGFITDTRGGSWFVSRDELPNGLTLLLAGTPVSFTGSPAPMPGRKYPRAQAVRPE
ncbi:NYN domain-containing protein [Lentzea albidocapillata subsp. violacea]|uniref:NYN domain-containing protein n=1 Tax=Lentzea albidocapillata subsp. violacea TaxID=128104 RepID=A0A1G9ISN1_9PSEU|nr:NYN domain-containing protein [Lentzea albidocapillata]SDL28102.1 NYN domain-containing protein [Lentzea albidocapillata subsp. violacea]